MLKTVTIIIPEDLFNRLEVSAGSYGKTVPVLCGEVVTFYQEVREAVAKSGSLLKFPQSPGLEKLINKRPQRESSGPIANPAGNIDQSKRKPAARPAETAAPASVKPKSERPGGRTLPPAPPRTPKR